MTDERYGKCDVCRYCSHSGDDWICTAENRPVKPKDECARYRPGCCENCSRADVGKEVCTLTGERIFLLGVCDRYDPCGRRTQ